ncbi:MAG: DsbA family protein [Hydrogenophilaceae bacterium]|jgi:protein-disulfide isomerase|nr:DsbA family protein [Hydrogenophilaceae bacterium]
MTFPRLVAALAAAALLALAGCSRQDSQAAASPAVAPAPPATEPIDVESFTPQQQTDMRAVVRDYLIRDPSVIREALEVLAARERAEREHAIMNDPRSFSVGPADAKVTVVEFFDYTCPFCQAASDWVVSLTRNHPDVRVVFKEYPVRPDPAAAEASRAAVAAMRQGRYLQFHQAMMGRSGPLTSEIIDDLARRSGIDVARMRRDMQDPAVDALLLENHRQAAEAGITGTPAFMINGEWMNGWPRENAEATMNARLMEAKRRAAAAR